MDFNQNQYYIYCSQEGHDNKIIEYICIYSECSIKRLCCNICIFQHCHDPLAIKFKYLIEYEIFKNLIIQENQYCSYFFTEITEKMINNLIDNQIVKITLSDDMINTRKCIQQGTSQIEASKFIISNDEKLIAFQDREQLCIFNAQINFKMIRKKRIEGNKYSVVFSTSDRYIYICLKDRIIQLDIQNNLSQNLVKYQYDDNSELKCITDTQILINNKQYIYIIDFQQQKQILNIDTSDKITSIDFQVKSNNIVIFNRCGIRSWNTSGQLQFTKPDHHYILNDETNISFFEDQDKIITVDYNKVIIWNIDYINENIILFKIIVNSRQSLIRAYNLNKNQIYFINNDFIAGYDLEQNKLKMIRFVENSDLIDDLSEKEFQILSRTKEIVILQNSIFYYSKKIMLLRNGLFKL